MTQDRTTLKAYFITGATPTESEFANLIDSTLLAEDVVSVKDSDSTTQPLSASVGAELNQSIIDVGTRVTSLEGAGNTFATGYYNKTEVDTKFDGVDNVINGLPYASQITALQNDLATTISNYHGKANISHAHLISDITNLQTELDAKASVVTLNSIRDSLIASINSITQSDETAEVASLQTAVNQINATISTLATKAELSQASGGGTVDLSNYYNKSEVDTLVGNVTLPAHTHTAAEISDLATEIQNKTTILMGDHTSLSDNPHQVTKEQIGLGNVENLTPQQLVDSVGALSGNLIAGVDTKIDNHIVDSNPHNITKSDIGLDQVPNIDFQSQLNSHLTDTNPHNINLDTFDVYSKAASDQRINDVVDGVFNNPVPRFLLTRVTTSARNALTPLDGEMVFDTDENRFYGWGGEQWQPVTAGPIPVSYALSASSATVAEGDSVTFTLSTTMVPPGTIVGYYVQNAIDDWGLPGTYPDGTFTVGLDGTATVTLSPIQDSVAEGSETASLALVTSTLPGTEWSGVVAVVTITDS